jgi:hypothetical protein
LRAGMEVEIVADQQTITMFRIDTSPTVAQP